MMNKDEVYGVKFLVMTCVLLITGGFWIDMVN